MGRCDDLARERARGRGVCEIEGCGATARARRMEWAHGFSRRYHAVRHLDANGRYLCYKHHTWYSDRGEEWREWLREKIGIEAFEEMRAHRNDRCDAQYLARVLAVLESGRPCTLKALDDVPRDEVLDSQQPAIARAQ